MDYKKKLILEYCKKYSKSDEESEKIYNKFYADKELLDELCFYIINKE